MSWSHGYNVDHGYTYGFYREQSPGWMDLSALFNGARPPRPSKSPIRYLELGCGQGFNLCLHAAAHPEIDFVGIDFNPQHIAHASQLAEAAGLTNLRFREADFLALAAQWPSDLGHFDYASAHGIASWIPKSVGDALAGCLAQALKPGGLFFTSYNTLPGWLSTFPLQHLLRLWQVRENLPSLAAMERGYDRFKALLDAKVTIVRLLPALQNRLEKLPTLDKAYLVQEYLHDNWRCFWFDEMHAELSPAKLRYLGTANLADWFLPQVMPQPLKDLLAPYNDPVEQQVMLDVLTNQSFRRDLWARGHHALLPNERREQMGMIKFALLSDPPVPSTSTNGNSESADARFSYQTSLGNVTGKPEVYAPLYEALKAGPKTLSELMQTPGPNPRNFADTVQALGFMVSAGHAVLYQPPGNQKPAHALNRVILDKVSKGAPYRHLVAPSLGTMISVSDTDMFMADTVLHAKGKLDLSTLTSGLVQRLVGLGRGLRDGEQTLTTPETMMPRAQAIAEDFLSKTWPKFKRLGVA